MSSDKPTSRTADTNWAWLSLIPFGLGSWAPLYAGIVRGRWRWCALGVLWSLITVAGWVLAIASNGGPGGGGLICLGWLGGALSSFTIRGSYVPAIDSAFENAVFDAEQRLSNRERAQRLARDRPSVAKEVGVGRPDLPDAHAAGLVDINNAPAAILAVLPGVDCAIAARIVRVREETAGFSSVEDLGMACDLDGNLVERLRQRVVFLPR